MTVTEASWEANRFASRGSSSSATGASSLEAPRAISRCKSPRSPCGVGSSETASRLARISRRAQGPRLFFGQA